MELDRLAEELAAREGTNAEFEGNHDLPVYEPLTHGNTYLSVETFSVEDFLLSRSYTSLPDLRAELRDYLATLKEELVKLINDDYEAFISLSTDLRGEGARLERLKWPLGDLRAQVLVCRSSCPCLWNAYEVRRSVVRSREVSCSKFKMLYSKSSGSAPYSGKRKCVPPR